ncbi:MAG: hypothetical protein ACLP50_08185 [Solirubrobacteraceae bacterium]
MSGRPRHPRPQISGQTAAAILCLAVAIGVVVLAAIAGAPIVSSIAFGLAAALAALVGCLLVRVIVASNEDDGGDDGGGRTKPDRPDAGPSPGGIEFDWESFEREFHEYADEHRDNCFH